MTGRRREHSLAPMAGRTRRKRALSFARRRRR